MSWSTAPLNTTYVWTAVNSAVPGWNSFELTGLVRHWVSGYYPNHGVRIQAPTAGQSQSTAFRSANYTGAGYDPELMVRYVPATRYGLNDMWTYTQHDYGGDNRSSVNSSTGNLTLENTAGMVEVRSFNIHLTHTYNSQDPYGQSAYYDRPGGYYGEGWTFSENVRLYTLSDGAVGLKDGAGGNYIYAPNTVSADGTTRTYLRPQHYDFDLTKNLSNPAPTDPAYLRVYTLTLDGGGMILYFDSEGKLTEKVNHKGERLTYSYDTSDRLTGVFDGTIKVLHLDYLGPGSPGRLSKITDLTQTPTRITMYGYDINGDDLARITHDAGTSEEATTTFTYGTAHNLLSVTNSQGQKSDIEYKAQYRWDTAGVTSGWTAEGTATDVAQSTEQDFRGTGSLKVDISGATSSAVAGIGLYPSPTESWNSIQQELLTYVYVPVNNTVNSRLVLKDSRGVLTYGPWWSASGGSAGAWTEIRMPDARVDPGYKLAKVAVQFAAPSGTSYTGSVWVDHMLIKGLAEAVTNGTSTPTVTTSLSYNWEWRQTTESSRDGVSVSQTIVYKYDASGQQVIETNPLSVQNVDMTTKTVETYTVDPATLPATEPSSPDAGDEATSGEIEPFSHTYDEPVRVRDTTWIPYKRVAHLELKASDGTGWTCTGWFSSDDTVVTAGHCLYTDHSPRKWANGSITVYPGRNGTGAGSTPYGSCRGLHMSVSGQWFRNKNWLYDYGAIHLNCHVGNRTGWFKFPPIERTSELNSWLVMIAGYGVKPGRPYGTQWKSKEALHTLNETTLHYYNNVYNGDSGAPVYQMDSGRCNGYCVIGIHSFDLYGFWDRGITISRRVNEFIRSYNNKYP